MFFMLKMKKYILPTFQNITQSVKNKSFLYWFQKEKDGISSIIQKNSVKTQWWLLLFELPSFV